MSEIDLVLGKEKEGLEERMDWVIFFYLASGEENSSSVYFDWLDC